MQEPKRKTARFKDVVAACGRPEPAFLWVKPDQDRQFKSAVRQERIMSVTQENSRKDIGEVGFRRGSNVTYLLFPKPLTKFRGRMIVGLHYDLLATPTPLGERIETNQAALPPQRRFSRAEFSVTRGQRLVRESETAPERKLYRVTLRFTASASEQVTVEAPDRPSARAQALKSASVPDLADAPVSRKILRVSEL